MLKIEEKKKKRCFRALKNNSGIIRGSVVQSFSVSNK
jgi:hypothetical protein